MTLSDLIAEARSTAVRSQCSVLSVVMPYHFSRERLARIRQKPPETKNNGRVKLPRQVPYDAYGTLKGFASNVGGERWLYSGGK
jgi:hypothetical protein